MIMINYMAKEHPRDQSGQCIAEMHMKQYIARRTSSNSIKTMNQSLWGKIDKSHLCTSDPRPLIVLRFLR